MYDLGTPCILFGVGPPEFSSKKSRCSGTSIEIHYAFTT